MRKAMIKILGEKDIKVSRWSGGVTKQLYIYPEDSDYALRNFKIRLSIATTELEKSIFTKLEGVDRVISILEGKMEICHKDHHQKTLLPYDIDHFKGDWDTSSKGKVTDFNLMLKGCKGDFFFKEIKQEEKIIFENEKILSFIYCISGELKIENELLKAGELAVTDKNNISVNSNDSKVFYGYINI